MAGRRGKTEGGRPGSSGCQFPKRERRHDSLWFVVRDDGVGISEEFMEKIFQPFEQEEPGNARNNVGSGLGLSIVYNLVQLMGGDIRVESSKHSGSAFTVLIPFQLASDDAKRDWEKNQKILTTEPSSDVKSLCGMRILLVEDNELNREIARTFLDMQVMVDELLRKIE